MEIVLRKCGNVIEISDKLKILPQEIRQILEPRLVYKKKKFLYGADRHCPITGISRNIAIEQKRLFDYDKVGRMICGFGMAVRIETVLREAGVPFDMDIIDPPRTREECFAADKGRITACLSYRERQEEAVDSIILNWNGVIHAVTGFGKMVLLVMICLAHPKAKIDIVTRRTVIANKIFEFLTRYLPNIGRVGDGNKDRQRITVYNADSLHHSDYTADIVLCDEAHELLADESTAFLAKYHFSRMFAFTASPKGRLDGADVRLESLFGQTIFYLPYWEAVELGLVVPIRVEWTDVFMDVNPAANKSDVPRKRWGLWRNAHRNQIIADKALSFGEDEQVLVLVDTVEHAVYLRKHLPGYGLVFATGENDKWDSYISHGLASPDEPKMTPEYVEKLRRRFEAGELKKMIATDVWSTGIDPTQLTALVRANSNQTETKDIQAPGRVSRTHKSSGKDVGIVCDFRDQFDANFMKAAKVRSDHYKAMRWEQV